MSTFAAPLPAVRAALTGLIDYAGLFPPAQLNMDAAAAEYAMARRGRFSWMLGRFIVPISRVAELRAAVPRDEPPFALSAILDSGWNAEVVAALAAGDDRVQVRALEMPLQPDRISETAEILSRHGLSRLPAYVEWPRKEKWDSGLPAAMEAVVRSGLGAKIRCGGVVSSAFPSPEDVAAFLLAAQRRGVRYKATAGLHHPVRHLDAATGFRMHGFLNLLFAAAFVSNGADFSTVEEIVADERAGDFRFSAEGLHWRERSVGLDLIESVRQTAFNGYGSCSFDEPVEDLQAMELL